MTKPFQLQPGEEPFPGFWLHLPVGRGGCGEVWETQTDEGPIALKFMRAKNTASFHARNSLNRGDPTPSPSEPRARASGFSQAEYIVIAMELADGSLMDVLGLYRDDRLRMSGSARLRYLMQAAEGLDFLNKPTARARGAAGRLSAWRREAQQYPPLR